MNLLLCVFFLLILPSLVVYLIRTLYLLLKRCHQTAQNGQAKKEGSFGGIWFKFQSANPPTNQNGGPIPPLRYCGPCPSSLGPFQSRHRQPPLLAAPNSGRSRRSESPVLSVLNVCLPTLPRPSPKSLSNFPLQSAAGRCLSLLLKFPIFAFSPLHGTHSLNIRPTTSLTLNEFHLLLLAMQREMAREQRREQSK